MRNFLTVLGWIVCFLLAILMLNAEPILQGMAIALATVPVVEGVTDPHAKVILGVGAFLTLSWIAFWVAEAIALIVGIELHVAFAKWWEQYRLARAETVLA